MSSVSRRFRSGILAVLGGVGYIAVAFQWFAVMIAWLPGFLDSRLGKIIFPKEGIQPEHATPALSPNGATTSDPDFVTTFLVTGLALALIALVVYVVIFRYTKAISKAGSQIVHTIAKRAAPAVARKPLEKISPRKRTVLNRRLLFWTKVIFTIVPFVLLPFVLHDGERGVIEQLAIFIQAVLAIVAVSSFLVQAMLIDRWHMRIDEIN